MEARPMKTADEILKERQSTHGEYGEHARCTQSLLRVMQAERNWPRLSDMQRESLHMIAHKIGRIMTGNPDHLDHYQDIEGYSRLISQRLENPIPVYDHPNDIAGALALAWNCTRREAIERHAKLIQVLRDKRAATEADQMQKDFEAEVEKVIALDKELQSEEPIPEFLTRKPAVGDANV